MSEIKLKEIDVVKLNPKPGDTLLFKIMSDELDENDFHSFSQSLSKRFPDQKVMVTMFRPGSDMAVYQVSKTSEASEADCSKPASYCNDCACGKKERVLAENNEVISAPSAEIPEAQSVIDDLNQKTNSLFEEAMKELEEKEKQNADQRTDKN